MPPAGVDILSSGDTVSELFLLLSGTAEVVSPDPAATAARASSLEPQGDSQAQVRAWWAGGVGGGGGGGGAYVGACVHA